MSVSLVTALNQVLWCLVLWWAVFWLKFAAIWARLVYVLKSLKASGSVLPLLQQNSSSGALISKQEACKGKVSSER